MTSAAAPAPTPDASTRYDYVGLDINERYLEVARRQHRGRFVNADLTVADLSVLGTFDTVLVNSFLHHISDADVERLLRQIPAMLSPDGRVHILELVLPPQLSMARVMAQARSWAFRAPPRSLARLFSAAFDPVVVEPYFFGGRSLVDGLLPGPRAMRLSVGIPVFNEQEVIP